jgi:cyclophilin family peptidyl-prolyl cis-trans isomerase
LWADVEEEWRGGARPLLAHYTSLDVLEKMLKHNELWFSNPLFMNDLEEVKFGILRGVDQITDSNPIQVALGTRERVERFDEALNGYLRQFEEAHLFDTYVFCLSEHDRTNRNGLLSMWRGYGRNGNGAALVFDTAHVQVIDDSPLVVGKVHYGTSDERLEALDKILKTFADVLQSASVPDSKLWVAAAALFERIKFFALFTKHDGFREEREWRVVYMPERDKSKRLTSMLHYFNGPRGVEPKLRFKVAPLDGVTGPDLSFERIIDKIILGPSMSSPLAIRSIDRMLDVLDRKALKDRVTTSGIPLRVVGSP